MSLRVNLRGTRKLVSRSKRVTKGSRYSLSFKTPLKLTRTKTKPHVIPVGHRFYFFANFTETR